jgi:DNA-binding transcriptional MocR family regulator
MELDCSGIVTRLGKWSVGPEPLYQQLAGGLKKAILDGAVPPDTLLPPERTFAGALAVSRSTVVAAYALLRQEGWLESRQGSGTKVLGPPLAQAKEFNPVARNPVFEQMLDRGEGLIDFSGGIPAELKLADLKLTHFDLSGILQEPRYLPQGLPELRQAIANQYSLKGIPTSEEQVLITNGAQQALALVAALYLQRGDTVVLENPTYFGAMDAFRGAGARLVGVTTDPVDGLRLDLLQRVLSTLQPRFIYLTPTFQNPTGAVMPVEQRKELVQLAEKNDLVLVEDNTLADLELDQAAPPPLAAFAQGDNVITIGSMSKLFWVGLRIGWVRAAPALINRLTRLKQVNDLGSGLVNQVIATRWLDQFEAVKEWRKQELLAKRDLMLKLLQEHLPDWGCTRPGGGLFLWVRIGASNAGTLAQLALRYGVVILPGNVMSADDSYSQYVRLPFLLDPPLITEGIARLSRAWESQAVLNKTGQPTSGFIV